MRRAKAAFIGLVVVAMTMVGTPALADEYNGVPYEIDGLIHAAADYRGANYDQMVSILRCESGNFAPDVIDGTRRGAAGEIGIAQILPVYGLGPLFESRGGDYSASDEIYFLAWALTHGLGRHWSCNYYY